MPKDSSTGWKPRSGEAPEPITDIRALLASNELRSAPRRRLELVPQPPPRPPRRPFQFLLYVLGLVAVGALVIAGLSALTNRGIRSPKAKAAPTTTTVTTVAASTAPSAPLITIAAALEAPVSVPRVDTPAPKLSIDQTTSAAALSKAWAAGDGRPIVLTYHEIAEASASPFTVTPVAFAEQMAALKLLDVHTLTAAEYAGFVQGKPVPPRSVMITFDDGARGVWRYADSILAQHQFRAVAFVITGYIGTRGASYMTWNEIDKLAASGRWDIESHTAIGHARVPINGQGDDGSFLSSLSWLPEANRLETIGEYQSRVAADLDRSMSDLKAHGYGKARLFASPFSDFGARTNDPAIATTLYNLTHSRFSAVFNDDSFPRTLNGPFQFNRLTLESKHTTVDLLSNITKVVELNKANPPKKP